MIKIIVKRLLPCFLLLSVSAFSEEKIGIEYDYKITRVIDGDTVAFRAEFLPSPLKPELSLRIYGVDTPEKGRRAKCELEAKKGQAAFEFTKVSVESAVTTKVVIMKWDKYGGRVLGDVIVDGQSLKDLLLSKGLAKPYDGGKKRGWCEEEGS